MTSYKHLLAADTPEDELDNSLHEFAHVQRNTLRRYFQTCGMYSGHPRVLFYLHRCPGMTQRELAKEQGIAAPTLSVSIRRMETAGLVERRTDEQDLRVQRLYLTEKGEEIFARCNEGRRVLMSAIFEDFSQDDVETLNRLLKRMTENIQRVADTLPPLEED